MAESGALAQVARSTWVHVLFAFVAMGAWAAFANRMHGSVAMWFAFVVQGGLSAILTLFLKRWLEGAFAHLSGLWARLVPPVVSCLIIGAALVLAHRAAGTPEVLATIALPWTVSTLYAFIYTATLRREG